MTRVRRGQAQGCKSLGFLPWDSNPRDSYLGMQVSRTLRLEKSARPVRLNRSRAKLYFRPFEIKTLRVSV